VLIGTNKAKAIVVVAVVGVVVVTIGNATVVSVVVPTATTQNAVRACDYFPNCKFSKII